MKRFFLYMERKFLGRHLNFRVRLFNVLALAGLLVSLISAVTSLLLGDLFPEPVIYLLFGLLSAGLLLYAVRSGRYRICYIITIVVIFIGGFSLFFWIGGAYYGSIPYFFVFAIVFTVFMLDYKAALLFSALEAAAYTALCLCAYYFYQPLPGVLDSRYILIETVFGFLVVGAALGVVMFFQLRLYNGQQLLLAEQNRELEEASRMKTELFANVSHEMKTPLTVISVHMQRAQALFELEPKNGKEKIRESFAIAQDEIMRLSRLIDSALKMSRFQELGRQQAALDMRDILRFTAEAYQAVAKQKGTALTLHVPEHLPPVWGNTDMLVQLISNLVSNANAHTKGGVIALRAEGGAGGLTITVTDNGTGIPPECLPTVFERRTSGGGGNGLGLAICQQIVRMHNGDIFIESKPGRGTTVTITLPAHKEGEAHGKQAPVAD